MNKRNIVYIANLRLPTDRAHGIQIMKMCEALSLAGASVELIVPAKRNNLSEKDVFDYYGVEEKFKIKRVRSLDLLGKTRRFGKLFYWIDLISFLISLSFARSHASHSKIYTRDPLLLLPFFGTKASLWAEIHDLPSRSLFFLPILKRVNGIVAITEHLKISMVNQGIKENRVMVAPDAIEPRDFENPVSQVKARGELSLPLQGKLVMYIGLLDDWKGYRTFLESSQLLQDDCQIVIIGGKNEHIEKLKEEYPEVIFLGFKPYKDLARHQRAADILVIPNSGKTLISRYYTSPLKLFAHMASGVPLIVSDLPSLREIVDESMANFFSPDDSISLAEVIKNILENPALAQGKALRALEEVKKYSWQKRAEKIIFSMYV